MGFDLSRFGVFLLVLASASAASAQSAPSIEATLRDAIRQSDTRPDIKLMRADVSGTALAIGLEVPTQLSVRPLAVEVENLFETLAGAISARHTEIDRIDLLVAHPGERLEPPVRMNGPPKTNPTAPAPKPRRLFAAPVDPALFPFGQSLRGKTIAISPGHGYIYYDSLGGYSTQRANTKWNNCGQCRGIIEDFETHEIAINYLIPLLEGAGAKVVLVRDRSYSSEGVTVDDGDMGYAETSGTFTDGSSSGGRAGDYRVSLEANATAEFSLAAPNDGEQHLSLWFLSSGNRTADARVDVTSPGGLRTYFIDQRLHGRRWAPIDLFDLSRGDALTVRLTGSGAGALISDAVRLGAGEHSSGRAWWQMGALPYSAYQEAPANISGGGSDVTVRPIYAEWFGADAYVSIHSNAAGGDNSTARGSVTYRFNCLQYPSHSNDPPAADCDDPVGSDALQALVHAAMMDGIKTEWDPNWVDRGTKVANFGELRELSSIPGVLVETAFHDNTALASGARMTDNQALHDPRFRRTIAYGIYKGVSEFLVGAGPLVPTPPRGLVAKRIDASTVEVDFEPVAGAMGYRAYVAAGGRTFDQGRIENTVPMRLSGLPTDTPVAIKVTALNAAGEGLPSRVVSARPSAQNARLLIIDGFEREDAWVQRRDNPLNTLMTHGLALRNANVPYDSAEQAALEGGRVSLAGYEALVVALGRESTEHEVLTPQIRAQIRSFSDSGGAVFFDGSEVAWALDARGDAESQAFLRDVFGARLDKDDAATLGVSPAPGGWLAAYGVPSLALDDGSRGGMESFFPDVFGLEAGAEAEMLYDNSTDVAAVRLGNNLLLGVALEMIVGPGAKASVLEAWTSRVLDVIPTPTDAGVPDVGPGPDAGPNPDGGPGFDTGPNSDAGVPGDGGPQPDAGRDRVFYAVGDTPVTGGCHCQHRDSRAPASAMGLLLLLLITRVRTDSRRRARSGS